MSSTHGNLTDQANGLTQFAGDELTPADLTPGVQRSAAIVICDRARDASDARQLLEACGLASYRRGKFVSYAFGRSTRS